MIAICGAELPDSLEELLEEGELARKKAEERRACQGSPGGSNEKEDRED
jgi:hypothetical protein